MFYWNDLSIKSVHLRRGSAISEDRSSRRSYVLWLIIIPLLVCGCYPYLGRGVNRPNTPISFIDNSTGAPIQEVLVIPEYIGVMESKNNTFLAKPFLYQFGKPFDVFEPLKFGLVIKDPHGNMFMGIGSMLKQLIVVAPGYKSICIWYSPFDPRSDREGFQRLDAQKAIDELDMMAAFFDKSIITGWDQSTSGLQKADRHVCWNGNRPPIKVDFNSKERKMIQSFIDKSINQISQLPTSQIEKMEER